MSFRKWKPSKAAVAEFKNRMDEVEEFLSSHLDISASMSRDSFYFVFDGVPYRVSNHSIEASNRGAYDRNGNQVRCMYHGDQRDKETRYIHASKTRIIDIYNAIVSGKKVDGRGNIVA